MTANTNLPPEALAAVAEWAAAQPDILGVVLFGSFHKGTATAGSDVDLAVVLPGDATERLLLAIDSFSGWRAALAAILGRRVDLQRADPEDGNVWGWLCQGHMEVYRRPGAEWRIG
jgi:predicted nucleotidyltransferase